MPTPTKCGRSRSGHTLDYIGVSAYFALADKPSPDALRNGGCLGTSREPARTSRSPLGPTRALHGAWIYRSIDFAAQYPWKFDGTTPVNLRLQADAYTAFFEAVWPKPWFAGVHWWKWRSSLDDGGADNDDFTPRSKPAEEVLRQFYRTSETGD